MRMYCYSEVYNTLFCAPAASSFTASDPLESKQQAHSAHDTDRAEVVTSISGRFAWGATPAVLVLVFLVALAAVLAVGPGASEASLLAFTRSVHSGGMRATGLSGSEQAPETPSGKTRKLSFASGCRDAALFDECYDMVMFLMTKGIAIQPTVYKDLVERASFQDVQARVHEDMPEVCAPPCSSHASLASTWGTKGEVPDDLGSELRTLGLDDEEGDCHTAEPGEPCYDEVIYAATDGVVQLPLVYHGLNIASSLYKFQTFLHIHPEETPGAKCPHPCKEKCHDAIEGEPCHTNVIWAMTDGIKDKKASEWFPGLTNQSSFAEFQMSIYLDDDAQVHCPKPCGELCRTAVAGEKCFEAVDWVMKVGVHEHPEQYTKLTILSSFEEVQNYLYVNKSEAAARCLKPCPPRIDLPL